MKRIYTGNLKIKELIGSVSQSSHFLLTESPVKRSSLMCEKKKVTTFPQRSVGKQTLSCILKYNSPVSWAGAVLGGKKIHFTYLDFMLLVQVSKPGSQQFRTIWLAELTAVTGCLKVEVNLNNTHARASVSQLSASAPERADSMASYGLKRGWVLLPSLKSANRCLAQSIDGTGEGWLFWKPVVSSLELQSATGKVGGDQSHCSAVWSNWLWWE